MVNLEQFELQVKDLLEKYPETRDSDSLLIMRHNQFYNHDSTIKRARRKIQAWARELILGGNLKLGSNYLGLVQIDAMRKKRAEIYRQYYSPKGAA